MEALWVGSVGILSWMCWSSLMEALYRKSKEKTDRNTTSERNQQRQTREYQTAEQNTSIKVKYCKTTYLIR
jgi:pyruvate formate-lyase activating enzyme-like uncharacterized protein